MVKPPEGRCGYTFPDDHKIGDKPDMQSCCWREALPDTDHCAWHADPEETNEKTIEALRSSREPPETRKLNRLSIEILDGAILSGMELTDSISFDWASLRGSDLSGADFTGARFAEANLSEANLRGSTFTEANLNHVDFSNANLRKATFTDARLSEAVLTSVDLGRADLSDSLLEVANLSNSECSGTDFSNTSLEGANLSNSRAFSADFSGAVLYGANFSEARLKNAILSEADLRKADLSQADLREVKLDGVKMNPGTKVGKLVEEASNSERWDEYARTYHNLVMAFSENGLVGKARRYHFYERRARGLEAKAGSEFLKGWLTPVYLGNLGSRLLTGYGVRPLRLVTWIVVLFGFSTLIYWYTGIENSMYYSVVTFTTAPPHPPTETATRMVAMVETFLGTLLIVLLGYVLGIRERF